MDNRIYLEKVEMYELPSRIIEERNYLFIWTGSIEDLLDTYYRMEELKGTEVASKIIVIMERRDFHIFMVNGGERYVECLMDDRKKIIGLDIRFKDKRSDD